MKKLFLLQSSLVVAWTVRAADPASASFLARLVPEALKYLNPPSSAEAKSIELDLHCSAFAVGAGGSGAGTWRLRGQFSMREAEGIG